MYDEKACCRWERRRCWERRKLAAVTWQLMCMCVTDRPALYESELPATRKVTYHQSFGGRPINLPDVSQHSTIDANTDKVCTLHCCSASDSMMTFSVCTPCWQLQLGLPAVTHENTIQTTGLEMEVPQWSPGAARPGRSLGTKFCRSWTIYLHYKLNFSVKICKIYLSTIHAVNQARAKTIFYSLRLMWRYRKKKNKLK